MTRWTPEQQKRIELLVVDKDQAALDLADKAEIYKAAKEKLSLCQEAVFDAIRDGMAGQGHIEFDPQR